MKNMTDKWGFVGTTVDGIEIIDLLSEGTDEGRVYYGILNKFIRSAVKIIDVREIYTKSPEQATTEDIIDTILNEIKILSRLRYPGLVRILKYGQVNSGDTKRDFGKIYMAMEYIQGKSLINTIKEILRDENSTIRLQLSSVVRALVQSFEIVSYMHRSGVTHLDLKPDNILATITDDGGIQVTIIDLGSSKIVDLQRFKDMDKKISPDYDHTVEQIGSDTPTKLYIKFDERYSPKKIKMKSGTLMDRKEILGVLFPSKDLYSLCLVIYDLVDVVRPYYSSDFINGLSRIAQQLKNYAEQEVKSDSEEKYDYLGKVLRYLRKLDPGFLSTVEIPELSTEGASRTEIMLNEGMVTLSGKLSKIINHPFFNRLNFVPQLEFEYLIFPDARHSRASHSLLTFHYMRQSLLALMDDLNFRLEVEREDIEGILLYSLLHDIGHYPLSHLFEDLSSLPGTKIPSDDDLFLPLLGIGSNSPYNDLVKNLHSGQSMREGQSNLKSIIFKYFGPKVVERIEWFGHICNKERVQETQGPTAIHFFLAGLIDSAIDLDKVAYLTKDSAMSGARIGSSINPYYYPSILKFPGIESIEKFLKEEVKGNSEKPLNVEKTPPRAILCIKDSGIATAESIILSRYWMVSRVYWHRVNRAISAAFKYVILNMLKNDNAFFMKFFGETFYYSETQALQWLSDKFDQTFRGDNKVYNPISALSEERSRASVFGRVRAFYFTNDQDKYEKLIEIAKGNKELELESNIGKKLTEFFKNHGVDEEYMKGNHDIFYEEQNDFYLKSGTILFDIPMKARDSIYPQNIMVYRGDPYRGDREDNLKSLDKSSSILGIKGRTFSKEFVNEAKKIRVFAQGKVKNLLEEIKRKYPEEDTPTAFDELVDCEILSLYGRIFEV